MLQTFVLGINKFTLETNRHPSDFRGLALGIEVPFEVRGFPLEFQRSP